MSDTQQKIGHKIEDPDDKDRDAVHIAVLPVTAAHDMAPGQPCGFVEDDNFEKVGVNAEPMGIVDPFLTNMVREGERFYMFLRPNTITTLRHEWKHKSIDDKDFRATKNASKAWIKEYARHFRMSYARFMEGVAEYLQFGEAISLGFDTPDAAWGPDLLEFWNHYEVVTGDNPEKHGRQRDDGFFRCAC